MLEYFSKTQAINLTEKRMIALAKQFNIQSPLPGPQPEIYNAEAYLIFVVQTCENDIKRTDKIYSVKVGPGRTWIMRYTPKTGEEAALCGYKRPEINKDALKCTREY